MRCSKCAGKGFIEGWIATGNGHRPTLEQCPERCNITGYSNEVQKRLNAMAKTRPDHFKVPEEEPKAMGKVLPFKRRSS